MNWDGITLYVLAGFGIALLILTQLRELLEKATEVIGAWRELRSSMRPRSDTDGASSTSRQSLDDH
ncbi:hypothetical protein [Streptomyces sp. NPDC001530]|uniref:hypothetical protein n=1 Tax=Streptomyces sp. NPDC001530 TaxID=3364582 RepID=UPI0036AEB7D8